MRFLLVSFLLLDACSLRDLDYLEEPSTTLDYHTEILSDAPTVYLRLGETEGTELRDEMGLQNSTYPPSGVTLGVPGALNGDADTAIRFDGTQGITMPRGLELDGFSPFTIELWARQTSQPNYGFTLDHEDFSTDRDGWALLFEDTEVSFERWLDDSTNGAVANSPDPLPLGTWHHVVVTFDGGQLELYIDNEVASLNAVGVELPNTNNTWSIGQQNCECSGPGFIGDLDEIAFYAAPLSAERVTAHYRAAGRP